jgi:alpha-glucoside transport system permease protein
MSTTPTPPVQTDQEDTGNLDERTITGTQPKGHSRRGKKFATAAVVFVCALWTVPTLGLLVSSFRNEDVVTTSGWWTVFANPLSNWTLENYGEVLSGGMGAAFVNSLVVAVPATVIPILAAAFAAYAFSWMRFPGREVLFVMIIGLLVVPLQVAFIPLLKLYGNVGVTGTFLGMWLAHTGFGMPLAVYLLRNYMGSIPREVVESARVDGASHFQTFWKLMVPLSLPALAAFAIFQFLWVWNDLLIALIFLGGGENQVVTLALSALIGSRGQDWHLLTAGAFVSMIVPMVVFFSLQRYFIRGLTAGSVKG